MIRSEWKRAGGIDPKETSGNDRFLVVRNTGNLEFKTPKNPESKKSQHPTTTNRGIR
jgi:hypothetical protein